MIKTKSRYSLEDRGTDRPTESISECTLSKTFQMIYDTTIKAEN